MQRVLVVDKNRKPLMPCTPARARELLKKRKAAILRRFPFTIILKEREGGETQETSLKIDSGAKTTGLAVVAHFKRGLVCIWAAELNHRGFSVRDNLLKRRQLRASRRSRKTRYRTPRFKNRLKPEGWLAPSLLSRLNNIMTWFKRLARWMPIRHLAMEMVKFDTQALQNPEISGVEYQQGELMGYEIREYLLEKWGHHCVYCQQTNLPLEIEHILPKSRGGGNSVDNLTLACHDCNKKKGKQTAEEFGFPNVQAQAMRPLNAAATMNVLRWALFECLQATGLPLELGTGGRTKFNRSQQEYPKAHWIDATCIGESGEAVYLSPNAEILLITAMGQQRRQMTLPDKFGFPRTKAKTASSVQGFKTGDLVEATVPTGKKIGNYIGRLAVRASGSFNITTKRATVQGISYRYCKLIHHTDGYAYEKGQGAIPPHA